MGSWASQTDSLLSVCVEAFGEPITYQRGATSAVISGIVDDNGQSPDAILGEVMSVGIRTAELIATSIGSEAQRGDAVIIRGIKYDVTAVLTDSEGMSTLTLKKSND